MIPQELLVYALQAHSVLLLSSVGAVYKYGDSTELIAKSMQGTAGTLAVLRRTLSGELAGVLRKGLASGSNVTTAVDPESGVYSEGPTDVFASEKYANLVRMFVESRLGCVVDCRTLFAERELWSRHTKRLRWCTIGFFAYQLFAVAGLFIARLEVISLSASTIKLSFAPSGLLLVAILASLVGALVAHDRINQIRMKYDEV